MPLPQRHIPTMARLEDQTDLASSMIDKRAEGSDKTKRRRFPHLSLFARKSCFRILRTGKHHQNVLCHEHEEDLKIAVAEMLYDWYTPNTPWGISTSSSGKMLAPQITMRRRQVLDGPQSRARRSQHSQPYQNQHLPGCIKKQTTYDESP